MTFEAIIHEIPNLSVEERKRLMNIIVDSFIESKQPQHSLLELEGLGKEIWEGIDAQEYVSQLRSEWDERP